jgi:hypothetical protein
MNRVSQFTWNMKQSRKRYIDNKSEGTKVRRQPNSVALKPLQHEIRTKPDQRGGCSVHKIKWKNTSYNVVIFRHFYLVQYFGSLCWFFPQRSWDWSRKFPIRSAVSTMMIPINGSQTIATSQKNRILKVIGTHSMAVITSVTRPVHMKLLLSFVGVKISGLAHRWTKSLRQCTSTPFSNAWTLENLC